MKAGRQAGRKQGRLVCARAFDLSLANWSKND